MPRDQGEQEGEGVGHMLAITHYWLALADLTNTCVL